MRTHATGPALAILLILSAGRSLAQQPTAAAPPDASQAPAQPAEPQATRVSCASAPGGREHCPANTSSGVVLARSTGEAACLLGKTWGYDDTGVWVSDGCSAEFVVVGEASGEQQKQKPFEHIPNVGFLLYDGDKGQIYFRLFSYARYLNQRNLDATYVDAFGNTKTVQQRQDMVSSSPSWSWPSTSCRRTSVRCSSRTSWKDGASRRSLPRPASA